MRRGLVVWLTTTTARFVLLATPGVVVPTGHGTVIALPLEDDDQYVQEVLDEDSWHHDEDNHYYEDPPRVDHDDNTKSSQGDDNEYEERLRRKMEEERLKQQAEADRAQRQRAEEEFARELSALSIEEQKILRQKRRRDGKIVQRILNAWQRQDYYAVLGLRWFFPEGIRLVRGRHGNSNDATNTAQSAKSPSTSKRQRFHLRDVLIKFQWPDCFVLRISTRAIQQAYRTRAVQVHPDKNRDPRTEQAFVAVQDAHAVLSDAVLRQEYEAQRRRHRVTVRQAWKDRCDKVLQKTVLPAWTLLGKVVGPLTVPVVVIGALVL